MAKIDDLGRQAQDRFRAANSADKNASLSDKLRSARTGQSMTAVGQRWNQDQASRRAQSGVPVDGEVEQPAAPARRTQAPAPTPFPNRPPPPPQRNSGTAGAPGASGPPPPPPRTGSGIRPPSLPSRQSATANAAPPALPPRMANEAGTANPPPPYPADESSGLSEEASSPPPPPPARRGPPPVPAGRNPSASSVSGARSPPPVPSNKPKPPAIPGRAPSTQRTVDPPTAQMSSMSVGSRPPPPSPAAASSARPQTGAPLDLTLTASRHPSTEPCKALSAATFFCYPASFPEWSASGSTPPWFFRSSEREPSAQPPPLAERSDKAWASSSKIMSRGAERFETQVGVAQFDDLSTLWYRIEFSGADMGASFDCKVAYAEPPSPWMDSSLLQASAAGYGELVARAAEGWEDSVVGDGECWTLVNEAILGVNAEQGWPEEIQMLRSIGRTHGCLIYYADADANPNSPPGIWRGGDVGNVRRGDILEWGDYAKCGLADGRKAQMGGAKCPDHTAVIVGVGKSPSSTDTPPSSAQTPLPPRDLVSLEVLEQSAGQPVTRNVLDLTAFRQGKMWIFRPCGSEAILEGKWKPTWDEEGTTGRRRGWERLN
ncbi:unnamed protein product [Jaminaea pallidilutea]